MLKFAGAGLIVYGCVGIGKRFLDVFRGRMHALQDLSEILELLMGVIAYEKSSLPQCCERVAEHIRPPFSEKLKNVAKRMKNNEGGNFGEVFRQETIETLTAYPLKTEDIEDFYAFSQKTGFADSEAQVRTIKRSIEKLQQERQRLYEEERDKSRVVTGLSLMSGLLLVLILW